MSETHRESSGSTQQAEMPWTAAFRYAKSRAFAPRTIRYWIGSVVVVAITGRFLMERSWFVAIVQSLLFVVAMECIEFVRRFLSGPPVGEAGKENY